MGSKIVWRPKTTVWSEDIFGPRRRRSRARLGVAALLCGVVAVAAYGVSGELAGQQETTSSAVHSAITGGFAPVVAVDASGSTGSSSPSGLSGAPLSGLAPAATGETTGSASVTTASPADANGTIADRDATSVLQRPAIPPQLPKPRIAKRTVARSSRTARVYTLPDGREVAVDHASRIANSSGDGFWGNDFGARNGTPIRLAHQPAFGWPF
jgi:hypothetical protein